MTDLQKAEQYLRSVEGDDLPAHWPKMLRGDGMTLKAMLRASPEGASYPDADAWLEAMTRDAVPNAMKAAAEAAGCTGWTLMTARYRFNGDHFDAYLNEIRRPL